MTGSSDIRNLRRPPLQTPVPVGLEEKDIFIKTRDGDEIRVRIYLPVGGRRSQDRFPVLVWFHGGGYCVGSVEGEEEYPRDFVQKVGGIAVSVDYRCVVQSWHGMRWRTDDGAALLLNIVFRRLLMTVLMLLNGHATLWMAKALNWVV